MGDRVEADAGVGGVHTCPSRGRSPARPCVRRKSSEWEAVRRLMGVKATPAARVLVEKAGAQGLSLECDTTL